MESTANSPEFLTLPTKPTAPISATYFPGSPSLLPQSHLVVFVNGLGLPASGWLPSITVLHTTLERCPPILTYDRFGQGLTSARDPLDSYLGKNGSHDFLDVVHDLHEIIILIATRLNLTRDEVECGNLYLLLVGNSIGGPLIRLYAQDHPGLVAAAIILDSNMVHVNYSDILPDPYAPGFDPGSLGEDTSLEQYATQREALTSMFDLNVKNAESLDRSNGPSLLPRADQPKLVGPRGSGTLLSIVGHDPMTFAEDGEKRMGTAKSISMKINQYWAQYNQGLTELTDKDKCNGVVIAYGCGHFIQADDPGFVAREIERMLQGLGW